MAAAPDILKKAAQHMEDRAAARDQPGGERSMARTVAAFNALTGNLVSERDGWLFMAVLKLARATTTPTGLSDDYEDGAAYMALAGEAASQDAGFEVEADLSHLGNTDALLSATLGTGHVDPPERNPSPEEALSALPLTVLTARLKAMQAEFRRRGLAVTLTVEPLRDVSPDDGN